MKFLRSLSLLAALLAAGALTPTPARSSAAQQQLVRSYQDGYLQGYNETQQNKCLDGASFEEHYQTNYLPRAQSNADYYAGAADGDYYRGYLDGLQAAYNDAASCN